MASMTTATHDEGNNSTYSKKLVKFMSLETGGRSDKIGNQYENRYFAKSLLELISESITSIEVEPLGPEGNGIEYIVISQNGERRYYQCKAANGINLKWKPVDLNRYSIFKTAKEHILRQENNHFYFISPVPYGGVLPSLQPPRKSS